MEYSFKSPLVVGYKGEIGSFILQGLLRTMPKASDIWCFDINETEAEKNKRIHKSDVIFLCVPIQDTVKWLLKYKGLLKNRIIIEQCSLKREIYEDAGLKDLNIMSMHILFRPSATPDKKDRRVGLVDIWPARMIEAIEKITDSETIHYIDYGGHDKAMAKQQALVHRVLLALGSTIGNLSYQTYIGSKVLELVERIKAGDPVLYKKIQSNEHLPKVMERFQENLHKTGMMKT